MQEICQKPNYEELYHLMFNQVTDAIIVLQHVQRQAEELFVQQAGMMSAALYIAATNKNKYCQDFGSSENNRNRPQGG